MTHMKKGILVACAIAAMIVLPAGCGKAKTDSGGTTAEQGTQTPAGTMGIIMQISSDSITIAVMPQGSGGFGGQSPFGSGAPQAPSGTMPAGEASSGAIPSRAMPTMDTSSWQKETFIIDSSTKIVQGRMPSSTGTESSSLTVSDLKTGDSVSITERSGTPKVTADQITVMQGIGGMPGRQGGPMGSGAPAPQSTANS